MDPLQGWGRGGGEGGADEGGRGMMTHSTI